jgi:hypothetical protein
MAKQSNQTEVILAVVGEGGGYTILGEQNDGHWRFGREPGGGDSWMYDEEEDKVETPAALPKQPTPEPSIVDFDTLDEALEQINSCWPILHPIQVHPAFVQDIWQRAVNYWREHDGSGTHYVLRDWSEICLGREIQSYDQLLKEEQAKLEQQAKASSATSRLSVEWPPFAEKLATALAKLEEDQYLILLVKRSNRFVQFAAQGSYGMRVETTSNAYLSKPEKLNKRQIATLLQNGWSDPTASPDESTPENDPDGSPNFFVEFSDPVSFTAVANLAVRTLAEILRVPHPGSLQYDAFSADGEKIALPELGLQREKPASRKDEQEDLPQLLLETLKSTTGIADLDYDDDGDIGVRCGSAVVFVRLTNDSPFVRIHSHLLRGVEESEGLLARLNDMNANEIVMHFIYRNDTVYAVADVCAAPFVADHVALVFDHFCAIADGIDGLLQVDFGGETAFAEVEGSGVRH